MESKFKVGDRVVMTRDCPGKRDIKKGMKGVIMDVSDADCGIKFDDKIRGHNLMKLDQSIDKNGWYIDLNNFKLSESDIHTDIQSLKDKYPQFNITVSVEEKG